MTRIKKKNGLMCVSQINYSCTTYNQNSGSQCESETTEQKES